MPLCKTWAGATVDREDGQARLRQAKTLYSLPSICVDIYGQLCSEKRHGGVRAAAQHKTRAKNKKKAHIRCRMARENCCRLLLLLRWAHLPLCWDIRHLLSL